MERNLQEEWNRRKRLNTYWACVSQERLRDIMSFGSYLELLRACNSAHTHTSHLLPQVSNTGRHLFCVDRLIFPGLCETVLMLANSQCLGKFKAVQVRENLEEENKKVHWPSGQKCKYQGEAPKLLPKITADLVI